MDLTLVISHQSLPKWGGTVLITPIPWLLLAIVRGCFFNLHPRYRLCWHHHSVELIAMDPDRHPQKTGASCSAFHHLSSESTSTILTYNYIPSSVCSPEYARAIRVSMCINVYLLFFALSELHLQYITVYHRTSVTAFPRWGMATTPWPLRSNAGSP